MNSYVAFLRGIAPMNPKQRNENLRAVCEDLGFSDVATVISSGNIIFRTDSDDTDSLEERLETAWVEQLGFTSTTIIRSRSELEGLVDRRPFGDLEHGKATYLLVTFTKHPMTVPFKLPHRPPDRDYEVVGATDRELFTVTDTTSERTPDVMGWIEKQFGSEVSSRTWLTVNRVLKRMA